MAQRLKPLGLTLDAGALIAMGKRDRRMGVVLKAALAEDVPVTVPAPVLAQWWYSASKEPKAFVDDLDVEPMCQKLAKRVGDALRKTGGSDVVDALVMVSAAARGDDVYTSDVGDLQKFSELFPGVVIFEI